MAEEDYTALLDFETEYDEPSEKVIDFCYAGLSSLPNYKNIGERDFSIRQLLKQANTKKVVRKNSFKQLKFAAVLTISIVFAFLTLQIVCMALGFDLFGYIFNWNKPDVIEIKNDGMIITINEDIEIDYPIIEELPIEMKSLVPFYLFDNFDFFSASYINRNNNHKNIFYFLGESNEILIFIAEKTFELNVEKDDDGYFEEYYVNDLLFMIFTNTGDYQVMWIKDEYIYVLYTHFDEVQELKNILDNLYND